MSKNDCAYCVPFFIAVIVILKWTTFGDEKIQVHMLGWAFTSKIKGSDTQQTNPRMQDLCYCMSQSAGDICRLIHLSDWQKLINHRLKNWIVKVNYLAKIPNILQFQLKIKSMLLHSLSKLNIFVVCTVSHTSQIMDMTSETKLFSKIAALVSSANYLCSRCLSLLAWV